MNKLASTISLPTHVSYSEEEIVDNMGDVLLIRDDNSVDTTVIRDVLNAYPEMIEILQDLVDPNTFNKDLHNRTHKLLNKLGEK